MGKYRTSIVPKGFEAWTSYPYILYYFGDNRGAQFSEK
jgi:hypothetical protein